MPAGRVVTGADQPSRPAAGPGLAANAYLTVAPDHAGGALTTFAAPATAGTTPGRGHGSSGEALSQKWSGGHEKSTTRAGDRSESRDDAYGLDVHDVGLQRGCGSDHAITSGDSIPGLTTACAVVSSGLPPSPTSTSSLAGRGGDRLGVVDTEEGNDMAAKKRFVIVCTDKRGVFFGAATGPTDGVDPINLRDAQMAVYWSANVRGVLGLAATGPTASCRISAPVPRMELRGVTAVMDCTPEAVQAWQAAPWSR